MQKFTRLLNYLPTLPIPVPFVHNTTLTHSLSTQPCYWLIPFCTQFYPNPYFIYPTILLDCTVLYEILPQLMLYLPNPTTGFTAGVPPAYTVGTPG